MFRSIVPRLREGSTTIASLGWAGMTKRKLTCRLCAARPAHSPFARVPPHLLQLHLPVRLRPFPRIGHVESLLPPPQLRDVVLTRMALAPLGLTQVVDADLRPRAALPIRDVHARI